MKELKAELKRGILHGKIIYVMMMVAILFALGWTENLSQAIDLEKMLTSYLVVFSMFYTCCILIVLKQS